MHPPGFCLLPHSAPPTNSPNPANSTAWWSLASVFSPPFPQPYLAPRPFSVPFYTTEITSQLPESPTTLSSITATQLLFKLLHISCIINPKLLSKASEALHDINPNYFVSLSFSSCSHAPKFQSQWTNVTAEFAMFFHSTGLDYLFFSAQNVSPTLFYPINHSCPFIPC